MDRRDFLKTTGAAAVTAGATGAGDPGQRERGRCSSRHRRRWRAYGCSRSQPSTPPTRWGSDPSAWLAVSRQPRTAAIASRFRRAQGRRRPDLWLSQPTRGLHRAFAFFAGLPFAQGLDAPSQHVWLAAGGGEMLWDDLAAEFGFKPLLAGHTGASAGVWAGARLEQASDLEGATLHVTGLAADAVRALGATPVEMAPGLKAALAEGRIRAAEWLGPLAAVSPDLQPLTQRLYEPGFHRGGMMLSLDVRKPLWDGMSASDRAIFEACAAQEYHLSLADARHTP